MNKKENIKGEIEKKRKELEDSFKNDILPKCKKCKEELSKSDWKIECSEKPFSIRLDAYSKGRAPESNTPQSYIQFSMDPAINKHINMEMKGKDTWITVAGGIIRKCLGFDKESLNLIEGYLKDFQEGLLHD